jgi:hypothetical protein
MCRLILAISIAEYLKTVLSRIGRDNVSSKHCPRPLDLEAVERLIVVAKSPQSLDVATVTVRSGPSLDAAVEPTFL